MKGSGFVFDNVAGLHFKTHGGWYIISLEWVKKQKSYNQPKNNNNNNCFQCAFKIVLNYENIGKHPERITKIKSFITQYD